MQYFFAVWNHPAGENGRMKNIHLGPFRGLIPQSALAFALAFATFCISHIFRDDCLLRSASGPTI